MMSAQIGLQLILVSKSYLEWIRAIDSHCSVIQIGTSNTPQAIIKVPSASKHVLLLLSIVLANKNTAKRLKSLFGGRDRAGPPKGGKERAVQPAIDDTIFRVYEDLMRQIQLISETVNIPLSDPYKSLATLVRDGYVREGISDAINAKKHYTALVFDECHLLAALDNPALFRLKEFF
jgi:hypothetical protein